MVEHLRSPKNKLQFPVQRVAAIVASQAAAIIFLTFFYVSFLFLTGPLDRKQNYFESGLIYYQGTNVSKVSLFIPNDRPIISTTMGIKNQFIRVCDLQQDNTQATFLFAVCHTFRNIFLLSNRIYLFTKMNILLS